MKIGSKVSLVAAAASLFFSAYSGHASAASGWFKTPLKGHAAVGHGHVVFALSNQWISNGYGWQVQWYDAATKTQQTLAESGTVIAVDSQGGVWVVHADNVVKNVSNSTNFTGWGCEQGNPGIQIRQEQGHNSLAFGGPTTPYIIEMNGRIRYWNSNCWFGLDPVPGGGVATDIAVTPAGKLRALNGNGNLYEYQTLGWTEVGANAQMKGIASTRGLGVGSAVGNFVIGMDSVSVWGWQNTSNPWYQVPSGDPTEWGSWVIFQLGSATPDTDSKAVQSALTGIDGQIWAYLKTL